LKQQQLTVFLQQKEREVRKLIGGLVTVQLEELSDQFWEEASQQCSAFLQVQQKLL